MSRVRRVLAFTGCIVGLLAIGGGVCYVTRHLPRQRGRSCIWKLHAIARAKSLWALDHIAPIDQRFSSAYEPTSDELTPYLIRVMREKGITELRCSSGGQHIIGQIGEDPACTYSGTFRRLGIDMRHRLHYWPDDPRAYSVEWRNRMYPHKKHYVPRGTNMLTLESTVSSDRPPNGDS